MINKEIQSMLIEVMNMLEGAENQDSHRVQEFKCVAYWLSKVNYDGYGEIVQEFYKEVAEVTT